MIAYLKGVITEISPTSVILEINNIGYDVFIPLSTFDQLPKVGSECRLLIYQHIREDQNKLFGFMSHKERDIFKALISISGVGPKLALTMLSGKSPEQLYDDISNDNVSGLSQIPGIGKKTAQRIIVELRGKLPVDDSTEAGTAAGGKGNVRPVVNDAVNALVNLGYKSQRARKAIEKVVSSEEGEMELEDLLKKSLKYL